MWLLTVLVLAAGVTLSAQSGGIVESSSSTTVRAPLTATQIAAIPQRGPFLFPAPYGTQGIRLTNASDCPNGSDCVLSVGYSYWRNINNHVGRSEVLVVIGLTGPGPSLFAVDKATGAVTNRGPLFASTSPYVSRSTEGWYFSGTAPTMLYLPDGPKLLRFDVVSRALTTVFDATTFFGPNRYIWQTHTSQDDTVHSFTLRDATSYAMLGCGAYLEATSAFRFFGAASAQEYDECQIDKSGRYLVIKDQLDGAQGEDNRIVDLVTGAEQRLLDPAGAAGHSDLGFGSMVAYDNFANKPGAVRAWDLTKPIADASQGRLVSHVTDWGFGSSHIAFGNAQPGVPLEQQVACASSAGRRLVPRVNEVLCFRLDGSLDVLVVAPIMTDLDAPGGGPDEYWKLPKGNLDVTGEYFVWVTNLGGPRQDAFLVRVPLAKLGASQSPTPTPVLTPPTIARRGPCGFELQSEPPDRVHAWTARIRRGSTNIGTSDSAYPYAPTATIQAGTYPLVIRWTASGQDAQTSPAVLVSCP